MSEKQNGQNHKEAVFGGKSLQVAERGLFCHHKCESDCKLWYSVLLIANDIDACGSHPGVKG